MVDYIQRALCVAPTARIVPVPYPYARGDLRVDGASVDAFDAEWQPQERDGHVYIRIPDDIMREALSAWLRLPVRNDVPFTVEGRLVARILLHSDEQQGDIAFDHAERLLIRALMDLRCEMRRVTTLLRAAFVERLRLHKPIDVLIACSKRFLVIDN